MAIKTITGLLHGFQEELEKGSKIRLGLGMDRFFTISPGEVLIVMARAGVGKTAWVCNAVQALVEHGYKTLFFSLEMSGTQILRRLAQLYYGLSKAHIEEWVRQEGLDCLHEFKGVYSGLILEDNNSLNMSEIRWKTKQNEPDVILIDYLQYIKGAGANQYQEATRVAHALKQTAKEANIALICISQTSRAGGDGTTPVTLDMARDTGAIEETADYLVGMWRDKDIVDQINARVLKNRHGSTGDVTYWFDADEMKFKEKGEFGW